jgi:hypothetical protein
MTKAANIIFTIAMLIKKILNVRMAIHSRKSTSTNVRILIAVGRVIATPNHIHNLAHYLLRLAVRDVGVLV